MATASARKIPAPLPNPETEPFWAAARQGKFLIRRCASCRQAHWYPRAICPFCGGATAWQEASGKAVIYTYSVMRRAAQPFAAAYVTLDEGPTLLTNIVDCDFDKLSIGGRVSVVFVPVDEEGAVVPMFAPD
ncbi:Zn-ribbon domain-containing OB-fold protein [Pollutimonas bauzanensis]|nr:OB-fold domain-containing protein [Pollutimonas bauzanensis]